MKNTNQKQMYFGNGSRGIIVSRIYEFARHILYNQKKVVVMLNQKLKDVSTLMRCL